MMIFIKSCFLNKAYKLNLISLYSCPTETTKAHRKEKQLKFLSDYIKKVRKCFIELKTGPYNFI